VNINLKRLSMLKLAKSYFLSRIFCGAVACVEMSVSLMLCLRDIDVAAGLSE
jgi:hypothetical protein